MIGLSALLIIAVLTVIVLIWAVSSAQALPIGPGFAMFGITRGQTARLNVVNVREPPPDGEAPPRSCSAELMFFDDKGVMLAMTMVNLMPGQAVFHDLNGDDVLMGREDMRA